MSERDFEELPTEKGSERFTRKTFILCLGWELAFATAGCLGAAIGTGELLGHSPDRLIRALTYFPDGGFITAAFVIGGFSGLLTSYLIPVRINPFNVDRKK